MFIERDQQGAIKGAYRQAQPGYAEEEIADDAAELVAFLNPPVRRMVSKGVIVERLIAAGKIEAARAALATLSVADQERWNAKPAVYADDPRALALLTAIDADPAVILAP